MCTRCWSLLCEVFCMGSAFTCTESACFADTVVVAGVEGVVVLKGVAGLGTVGIVLESYWHCTALYLFHISFNIWNMFDILFDVPLTVLFPVFTQDIPFDIPFNVPFPVLPPFILLELGTFFPFTTILCG